LCNQEVKQLALHAAEARGLDKLQTTVQSALVSENEPNMKTVIVP
jgi:hypothetical protein